MQTSSASIATPANTPSALSLARLAIFWLGIQALWGALLGISVQARVQDLAGSHALVFYGYLATIGAIVAACTQLVVGPWSDRRRAQGSRRVEFYVVGVIAGTAALLAVYTVTSFMALIAAYCALEAALNIAIAPYQAAIPDAVEPRSMGRASAWMAGFQSFGNAIGAMLATLVHDNVLLACVLAVLLVVTCAVTARTMRRWPQAHDPPSERLHFSQAFVVLFMSRVALFCGFYTLLGYMFFYTVAYIAPNAQHARTVDGVLILLFTLTGACGAALAAKPADRYDRRIVATTGACAAVAALALFIFGKSAFAAAIAVPLGGIGWGIFLVADWAIACRVIPAGAAAGAMAVWNLAILLPQVLAPLATTAVIAQLHSDLRTGVVWAFFLAGMEMLIGIVLLRRLPARLTRE